MSFSLSKAFNGILLVAGTAIGAGMLALPVATAAGGFIPAFAMYLLCWIFMACTGLLILEVCIWMPHDANMVSMSKHLLGKPGKFASWALYLFLFYSLTIAYIAGGGGFFTAIAENVIPSWLGIILFVVLFGPIVYLGHRAIHAFNFILMIGLVTAYFGFVILGWGHVDTSLLKTSNWVQGALALPVIFTAFSFQGVIPHLNTYMQRNTRMVRLAIIVGTSIPFVAYVIWEFLILGIVPVEGADGLLATQAAGQTAVFPLKNVVNSAYIYLVGQFFAFFALTTSFLGVTLGLVDFLADGLSWNKSGMRRLVLCLLVFLPPTCIALINPHIFFIALNYAGGIGCALLLGLLPVIMVWVGRYKRGFSDKQQLPGGKIVLTLLAIFVAFELFIEFYHELHRLGLF
ncbi:MAG: amino acid permease [Chlamydiae bacterium]|nr:amino acid permease [Chlamydiota bacterium]